MDFRLILLSCLISLLFACSPIPKTSLKPFLKISLFKCENNFDNPKKVTECKEQISENLYKFENEYILKRFDRDQEFCKYRFDKNYVTCIKNKQKAFYSAKIESFFQGLKIMLNKNKFEFE